MNDSENRDTQPCPPPTIPAPPPTPNNMGALYVFSFFWGWVE